LTDDDANTQATSGEIAGPVFLPLRPRPAALPANDIHVADDATRDGGARETNRRRRPVGDKLRFEPNA
jgi:hypothetical protein